MVGPSTSGRTEGDGANCCRFLQTLVAIRLRTVSDPESRRHLAWAGDMAAALDMLSRRQEAGEPFDAYLEDAAVFWRRAFEARSVRLETRGVVGLLPEAQKLPLAVVLHELLGNAARHAFQDQSGGAVALAFTATRNGLSAVVRDTGVGAAEVRPRDGLSLVEGLIKGLGGSVTIETAPSAGFAARISLPPAARVLM